MIMLMHVIIFSTLTECSQSFESDILSALICPGEQVVLTCHTNLTLLKWSIIIADRLMPEERFISSTGSAESQAPLFINHTEFQFLRTSTSPLKSTVLIDNVTDYLNGSRVECTDGNTTSTTDFIYTGNDSKFCLSVHRNLCLILLYTMLFTETFVDNISYYYLISEEFSVDNVTVRLQWAYEDVLFNVTIETRPYVPVMFFSNYTAQLTVLYNNATEVIFESVCGQKIINKIRLHYGELLKLSITFSIA